MIIPMAPIRLISSLSSIIPDKAAITTSDDDRMATLEAS